MFVVFFYRKQFDQQQRFVIGLMISCILCTVFDIAPQWDGWSHAEMCSLLPIFEGARFVVAFYEGTIVLYAMHAIVRTQLVLRISHEIAVHFLCWSVGVAVGIATVIRCRRTQVCNANASRSGRNGNGMLQGGGRCYRLLF